jgi:hypothetical protein
VSDYENDPNVAVWGVVRTQAALEIAEAFGERSELWAQEHVLVGVVFENEGSGDSVLDHIAHVSLFGERAEVNSCVYCRFTSM